MTSRRAFVAATAVPLLARFPLRLGRAGPDWRARKSFVEVHGLPMAYIHTFPPGLPPARQERTIVLLHGNPTSSYLWRNILPGLAPLGECIALDLIGMGDSAKLAPSGEYRYRFVEHRDFLDTLLERLGVTSNVVLVVHDWGGILGFDWARRHPKRVVGIAHMETVMDGLDSSQAPAAAIDFFRRYRTAAGAAAVLEQNQFVERVLLDSLAGTLTEEDRAEYRRPFLTPGESRRPTLAWPREYPIDGQPADVAAIVAECQAWLATSPVPKLFINAEPGALVAAPSRKALCRSWPNTTEVTVWGHHFVPEESPVELTRALVRWIATLS